MTITNTVNFHLGVFEGVSWGCSYAFFSDYGSQYKYTISDLGKDTVCQGETVKLVCNQFPDATYLWEYSNNSIGTNSSITIPNIQSNQSGYYKVSGTVSGCRVLSDSIYIHVNTSVNILDTATICRGQSYIFYGDTLTEKGDYQKIISITSDCDTVFVLHLNVMEKEFHTINAIICYGDVYQANGFNVSDSGTYYDTLINRFGCDSIVVLNLTVKLQDTNRFSAEICEGERYTQNNFNISESGTYTRNLKNIFGCDSTVILDLTVKPTPDIEIIAIGDNFCEKESIILQIITNVDDFQWSTGSLENHRTVTKAGTYIAIAKIENCEKTAKYIVEECPCEVWLPNAFSPNGDRLNDEFSPVVYSTLHSFSMHIYDRWGQLMYRTNSYTAWDGTVRGRHAAAGVYYCVITYSCANDPTKMINKQGSVTLVR